MIRGMGEYADQIRYEPRWMQHRGGTGGLDQRLGFEVSDPDASTFQIVLDDVSCKATGFRHECAGGDHLRFWQPPPMRPQIGSMRLGPTEPLLCYYCSDGVLGFLDLTTPGFDRV
jgi:hypothetical protein